MKKKIKVFEELTAGELYEILKVRSGIFVVEQNCVYQDMDDIDYDSTHIWFEDGNRNITAYARIFFAEGSEKTVHMGRVLTVTHGIGLGAQLLTDCILAAFEKMGAERICIEAQTYAAGFYEREGFTAVSDEFMLDGIPHVKMILEKEAYFRKGRISK